MEKILLFFGSADLFWGWEVFFFARGGRRIRASHAYRIYNRLDKKECAKTVPMCSRTYCWLCKPILFWAKQVEDRAEETEDALKKAREQVRTAVNRNLYYGTM